MKPAYRNSALALLAGAVVLAVGACGDNLGPEETLTLPSTASLDGMIFVGAGSAVVTDANNGTPITGHLDPGGSETRFRQFYSFALNTLPADAEIQSATLRLYQVDTTTDVYGYLGNVVVDHVDYGTSLVVGDYDAQALTSNIGTLSTTPTLDYKTLVVTSAVRADQGASRLRSQFRVRFQVDGDANGIGSYAAFTDQEDSYASTGFLPQLVIVYRRPQ